jgi:hypothetical protein
MQKALFVASILTAGAVTLLSAEAAPRLHFSAQAAVSGTDVQVVRQANEAPRHEDRQKNRREDRRASFVTQDGFDASGIVLVREAKEGPRHKDPR